MVYWSTLLSSFIARFCRRLVDLLNCDQCLPSSDHLLMKVKDGNKAAGHFWKIEQVIDRH